MHVELDRSEATRERGYATALFKLMRPHLTVMCACWQWSLQAVLRVDVTRYLLLGGTCGQPLGVKIIQSQTYSSDGLVDCGGTSNFVGLLFPGRSTLRCPGPCLISCIHADTRRGCRPKMISWLVRRRRRQSLRQLRGRGVSAQRPLVCILPAPVRFEGWYSWQGGMVRCKYKWWDERNESAAPRHAIP